MIRFLAGMMIGFWFGFMISHAHAEPTVHRVMVLCESEDPQCKTELMAAIQAAFADPYWDGIKQICPERHPARKVSMEEALTWFFQENTMSTALWPYSARIGMLRALGAVWSC
jgi:hypothetical protein